MWAQFDNANRPVWLADALGQNVLNSVAFAFVRPPRNTSNSSIEIINAAPQTEHNLMQIQSACGDCHMPLQPLPKRKLNSILIGKTLDLIKLQTRQNLERKRG